MLEEREKEKSNKYRELAADLAIQDPGWKVDVISKKSGSLAELQEEHRSFQAV